MARGADQSETTAEMAVLLPVGQIQTESNRLKTLEN